jgi:chromosome segregation ATPase
LKSDILGLRKELKAAKAAPASLEKERDGLRKDLEKLKIKLGDVEAKLKSTLIEKSKVEVGDVRYLVHLLGDVGNARASYGLSATVLYEILS